MEAKKGTVVQNCQFYGVKWDKEALEALINVSKAVLNLTELFKSQDINIETLLQINADVKATPKPISVKEKIKKEV